MWATHSGDYCKAAIANLEKTLPADGKSLSQYGDGKRPYPSSFHPEIDTSAELDENGVHEYQQHIGVLRWANELGRIDIMTEVSCLSQHLRAPRVNHLEAVYKIYHYMRKNMKYNVGRLGFDPTLQEIDDRLFDDQNKVIDQWRDFYPEAIDPLPHGMPEALGKSVQIICYVDANHAGNLLNRRSHSGILIYVNNTPVIWYSKRQNTVETSSFGSEFVTLRTATELVEALRYKLRCFGVRLDGPASIFCDNKSVVTNANLPTSMLNKRHNAICYHRVRESQAAGRIRVGWIPGERNLADLLTKTTMAGNARHSIVEVIFHNKAAKWKEKDYKNDDGRIG